MFNPGETVIHQFVIPFLVAEVSKVVISYKQENCIVFEKTITSGFQQADNDSHKTKFNVTFSQEESLMFNEMRDFYIQLNVLTSFGTRATSREIRGHNGAQYHKEVISS